MNIRELAKIDLNLLIPLQVLLEEKNVSRAAEQQRPEPKMNLRA
jgi:hypothetical protein